MVGHWQPSWVVALAASCVIHTGLVGAVMVVGPSPGRAPESDVLQADLVPPASPAPVAPPLPARPPRPLPIPVPPTRLTLAKPMAAPRSDVAETPAADIPPPRPEPAHVPAPGPPAPTSVAAPAGATPLPGTTAPAATAGGGAPPATPGDLTWPVPQGASAAPERAGPAGGGAGPAGAPSVARATGDATTTAYPRAGDQVRPSYPASARRLGIQGTSLLRVFVTIDGRVGQVVVQESAGHPDLDHAAADAVRRWRFEPARRGADAVAMWVLLPVEFHLK